MSWSTAKKEMSLVDFTWPFRTVLLTIFQNCLVSTNELCNECCLTREGEGESSQHFNVTLDRPNLRSLCQKESSMTHPMMQFDRSQMPL
jgi:hypothetical protein